VQVGDDYQLGSRHDLLGRAGKVDERIRRAPREGRPRVLRREEGVEEQLVPGVVEALRGVAEEPEAHQGIRPSRMAQSLAASRLPPEMTQTVLRAPGTPARAAATDAAPAPSAMTRWRSARTGTAAPTASRGTTREPASSALASGQISGRRLLPPMPSTKLG